MFHMFILVFIFEISQFSIFLMAKKNNKKKGSKQTATMNAMNPSSKDIITAARNGKLAANYYGFTCDWCRLKGSETDGWYDNRSLEKNFVRGFTSSGAEIRVCISCAKNLKKIRWLCCSACV